MHGGDPSTECEGHLNFHRGMHGSAIQIRKNSLSINRAKPIFRIHTKAFFLYAMLHCFSLPFALTLLFLSFFSCEFQMIPGFTLSLRNLHIGLKGVRM